MEEFRHEAWGRCLRLDSGYCRLAVSLDFGPRILSFERDGVNVLGWCGRSGEAAQDEFQLYGGHRLWVAPEDGIVSYEPDNQPVSWSAQDSGALLPYPLGPSELKKSLIIHALPSGEGFLIQHQIQNRGSKTREVSVWGLTVMQTGGECLIPQPAHADHPVALLPARPLVLWPYSDMADPRWSWGKHVIRLRHDPERGPQKVGAFVDQGIAVYSVGGMTFVKRFSSIPGLYPDMGCNFETFTRQDMLEVESLGPMTSLQPGESVVGAEAWYLVPGEAPHADVEAGRWLSELDTCYPHVAHL